MVVVKSIVSHTDSSSAPRGKSKSSEAISRHILKKKKKRVSEVEEAGEETDEGDMESREVDYMSDSSSNSELEFLVNGFFSLLSSGPRVVG